MWNSKSNYDQWSLQHLVLFVASSLRSSCGVIINVLVVAWLWWWLGCCCVYICAVCWHDQLSLPCISAAWIVGSSYNCLFWLAGGTISNCQISINARVSNSQTQIEWVCSFAFYATWVFFLLRSFSCDLCIRKDEMQWVNLWLALGSASSGIYLSRSNEQQVYM